MPTDTQAIFDPVWFGVFMAFAVLSLTVCVVIYCSLRRSMRRAKRDIKAALRTNDFFDHDLHQRRNGKRA